ncbi:glycerophosphodiester phosphodiesterase [Roseiflexus castenholzii]|jgi:glycerophosphoryl diester phosphodiesterase|uniref:Glycerophosphodiester phosphodiesterase n=1 Tax=Roseiflexus castenholzii (strain DSM 13941 / HLO8) TaxID=383372 RepID=A7NIL3_ROSCS|nr:glycerophosphodiester phosphodiesterase family protein [Roseiflexus castenholzii]ABU57313.1 Glycerophosphodiester phosphodiesterase [Roseiflexus castenholzii DSM 13941]
MTLVIAHRGASAYAPENTMRAFELAARQGADMCELDVQRTADGGLVVFHDDTTARWETKGRPVTHCTLADLQQIDIGGERVATLAEVCVFARERGMQLNVELKARGIGADVVRLLRNEQVIDQTLISSFWDEALAEIAAIDPDLPRALLMGIPTFRPDVRLRESWPFLELKRIGAVAWHPACQIPLLDHVLPIVRRAGYRVHVWTVNDPDEMRRFLRVGVDGIITDTPDVLRRIVAE